MAQASGVGVYAFADCSPLPGIESLGTNHCRSLIVLRWCHSGQTTFLTGTA